MSSGALEPKMFNFPVSLHHPVLTMTCCIYCGQSSSLGQEHSEFPFLIYLTMLSVHGMAGRLVNNELEDLKGSGRHLIEIFSRHFPGEIEISIKTAVSSPRLELSTSEKKVYTMQ
jgi:hypothetical protein